MWEAEGLHWKGSPTKTSTDNLLYFIYYIGKEPVSLDATSSGKHT